MNTVINSFMPAIAYALQNFVVEHEGKRYVQSDFGSVLLREKMVNSIPKFPRY